MKAEIENIPPSRLADNLFFIGVKGGPCYLLETSVGLVLIDTAYPNCEDMIAENMRAFGFDMKNIWHIIHTHGHIDHIGSTKKIVQVSGAKTYIGQGDEDAVMGNNRLLYADELNISFEDYFVPDVILKDNDKLDFGDTEIQFFFTPGHTRGTLSLFFNVKVDGQNYRAGMFGGTGLNTLQADYLNRYNLPFTLRLEYLDSIERLERENVDFHLGNHLSDNNYYEKIKKMDREHNPFLEENTYLSFLQAKKKEIKKLLNI